MELLEYSRLASKVTLGSCEGLAGVPELGLGLELDLMPRITSGIFCGLLAITCCGKLKRRFVREDLMSRRYDASTVPEFDLGGERE